MQLNWYETSLKSLIVLVPSYFAAYTTEKMVWVVPTLVAAGFFANGLVLSNTSRQNLDEEDGSAASEPVENKDEMTEIENAHVGRGELPDT
ncbi:MAG: hypothetical protein AAGE13_10145 [Pseudomonadota bacterium]